MTRTAETTTDKKRSNNCIKDKAPSGLWSLDLKNVVMAFSGTKTHHQVYF